MTEPRGRVRSTGRLLCLLTVLVGGSAETETAAEQGATRATVDALSRVEADARAQRLDNLHYELTVDLTTGEEVFAGEARLRFDLVDARQPLTVDFSGAQDLAIELNGDTLTVPYNGYFLTLPAAALAEGSNQLTVRYRHPYSRDGTGLHRFTDPEDGRTYLYTYLWPYYANRLLPLFDQPNLKARFALTVTAPEGWTVASTGSGAVATSGNGVARWRFAETPPISSYVFSLHAGPYRIWEDQAGDVPLRLLARESLADHVAVAEWFEVTRGGLEFYAHYFEIPYPFGKYDQLIVPDFNIGAMENIAAVTFGEQFVQREVSSLPEREARAGVILHEMAHMWFGNLVTHEWWNGLWLNESFATQMAHMALTETTRFTDAWHRFFTEDKQRAYHRDSRVTTHPIEMPIASTADFFTVFDAITYEKGSSVLKQLAHLVGEEHYRQGVGSYLAAHAYGTTELPDFIGAQAEAAQRSLESWADQWLHTAGFNTLEASFECAGGTFTQLTVAQTASLDTPTLRMHRLDIALVTEGADGVLTAARVLPAEIAGELTDVPIPPGTECPTLVFANYRDWGYLAIAIPEETVQVFADRIPQVEDPLARSALIDVLADRARDGELSLASFVGTAMANARTESNFRVLNQLVGELAAFHTLLERLSPEADGFAAELGGELEELAWKQTLAETTETQRLWFDLYASVAHSTDGLERLRAMLDGKVSVRGLPLSQDRRWALLLRLAAYGDVEARVVRELAQDPSDRGEKMAIAVRAAQPDLAVKRRWLEAAQDPASALGLARKRSVFYNLVPPNQLALGRELLAEILGPLGDPSGSADHYYTSHYVRGLLSGYCTTQSAAALSAYLEDSQPLSSTARRFLREAHQAADECAALQATLAGSPAGR